MKLESDDTMKSSKDTMSTQDEITIVFDDTNLQLGSDTLSQDCALHSLAESPDSRDLVVQMLKSNDDTDTPTIPNILPTSQTCIDPRLGRSNYFSWICLIVSIASSYFASISITLVNKYLFDISGFDLPLFVTFIHFSCLSLILYVLFTATPFATSRPVITKRYYFTSIFPISLLNSLDVAFSNLAYREVSLSVMTIIKSTVVVLTYLFSVAVGLERFDFRVFCVVIIIVSSISLTVRGMQIRHVSGIFYLVFSVISAAARWVCVHHQIQVRGYSPTQLMFMTQPTAAACLALPAFLRDAPKLKEKFGYHQSLVALPGIVGLIMIAVILAAILIYAEFQVVRQTSSVSFTIVGVGKEILTIFLSVIIFGEHVNLRTCVGIVSSIIAIILYSHIRLVTTTKKSPTQIQELMNAATPVSDLNQSQGSIKPTFPGKVLKKFTSIGKQWDGQKYGYHPISFDGAS